MNVFSYHKNLVYPATHREYQWVMLWRLIIVEVGTDIQHIAVVDNIVSDTLSILPYTSVDKYKPSTSKSHFTRISYYLFAGKKTTRIVSR